MQIKPLDLVQKLHVFDGIAPEDWYQKIDFPNNKPEWDFSLDEAMSQSFKNLQTILGENLFQQIIDNQAFKIPQNEWQTYTGYDDLPIHYFFRKAKLIDCQILILVSSGEFQPARYKVHIEGVWQLHQ